MAPYNRYAPDFSSDFAAPALEGGIQSLFSLAAALTQKMPFLDSQPDELLTTLSLLGECSEKYLRKSGSPGSDLSHLWIQFFNDLPTTRRFRNIQKIMEATRKTSLKFAVQHARHKRELTDAHENAYLFIASLFQNGRFRSLSPPPASLNVIYDHSGRHYCASASRLHGRIYWAHQPVKYALYQALVADLVIAHEYLSHLLPRCPDLGRGITEVWLVEGLAAAFRESTRCRKNQRWKIRLWHQLREELMRSRRSGNESVEYAGYYREEGPFGVDAFVWRLYERCKKTFWEITFQILELPNDVHTPRMMDEFLQHAVGDPDTWLDKLCSSKYKTINELL